MKFLQISFIFVFYFALSNAKLQVKYFTQKLDHFNNMSRTTFQQRYYENRAVYELGGPIILFVGGLEPVVPQFILGGPLLEIAVEHKGVLINLEHRYFGESVPFNGNLTLDNMKFLTIEHALEDISTFIGHLNETVYNDTKVILAGVGYSGALAIWHRQSEPDLTKGAWVSSPMILSQPELSDYKKVISSNLIKTDHACNDKIHAGFEEMLYELTWLNQSDRIERTLGLCEPLNITDRNELMHLFDTVSSILEVVTEKEPATILCKTLKSIDDNILALSLAITTQTGSTSCLDTNYNAALERYQNDFDETGKRPELYLACNELGWFKTGANRLQPFGYLPTLDYFVDLCQNVIDPSISAEVMNERAYIFNWAHGGLSPRVKNVFATVGLMDPNLSVIPIEEFDKDSKIETLASTQHGYDLYWWIYSRSTYYDLDYAIRMGIDLIREYLKK